jgi:hypothetical protein
MLLVTLKYYKTGNWSKTIISGTITVSHIDTITLTVTYRLVDTFPEQGHAAFKSACPAALARLMVPMATPERSAKLSYQFRFVADARGAYRSTAARVVALLGPFLE